MSRAQVRDERRDVEPYLCRDDKVLCIGFPRCGCHWFRMVLELYFDRPTLPTVFYHHDYPRFTPGAGGPDYLFYYTHDIDLNIVDVRDVLYLYRDAVDVVYSHVRGRELQLGEPECRIPIETRVLRSAEHYGKHLDKWLDKESFTEEKTAVSYEKLLDSHTEWFRAIEHLSPDAHLDGTILKIALRRVTKEEVQRRCTPEQTEWVARTDNQYKEVRAHFRETYAHSIWDCVLRGREYLATYFAYLETGKAPTMG